jgi:hypothetical protein
MQQPLRLFLRATLLATVAATSAGCISNSDITSSVTERAALAARIQEPVPYRELNPPPSAVEIRAHCWMQHERDATDLETKTVAVQRCVSERRNSRNRQ